MIFSLINYKIIGNIISTIFKKYYYFLYFSVCNAMAVQCVNVGVLVNNSSTITYVATNQITLSPLVK